MKHELLKYGICSESVVPVVHIGGNRYVAVSKSNSFNVDDNDLFDEKDDAMYENFLRKIKNGTPVRNFKSSKYFKYYINRLCDEDPEWAI